MLQIPESDPQSHIEFREPEENSSKHIGMIEKSIPYLVRMKQ